MSGKVYSRASRRIAMAILALALVFGLVPVSGAFGDDEAAQSNPATPAVAPQDVDTVPDSTDTETLPDPEDAAAAPDPGDDATLPDSQDVDEDATEPGVSPQSEATYTIASFTGYQDMFTALAKGSIEGDDKTTVAALGLPDALWVTLDDESLAAYRTDEAAAYAASEAARTAHNDAVSSGTPPVVSGIDPYTNLIIPEGAVRIPVTDWVCRDDYEATDYELYTFDPMLDENFAVATGVEMPFAEVEVAQSNPLARETIGEPNWIGLVNTYTAGKGNAAYSDHFYAAVPFDSTGGGHLAWVDSGVAAADRWDGTADATCPKVGNTYSPVTPEQLLYALNQVAADTSGTTPFTIELPANGAMDLGGREHNLWPYIKVVSPLTLKGNGCTLYNLYMCNDTSAWNDGSAGDHGTGLISDVNGLVASDLDIDGANLLGYLPSGTNNNNGVGALVGKVYSDSARSTVDSLTNIQVRHALIVARGNGGGALLGRFVDSTASPTNSTRIIEDCSTTDVVAMGGDHIGGLTGAIAFIGGLNRTAYINRCYATNATVVSYGNTSNGHSGGLFSCLGGNDFGIANCFVDAQVYGQSECGVFTGSSTSTRVAMMNCFSSGFVDGVSKLGGFIGSAPSGQVYFFDCYSTALVGVSSSGESVGGFMGYSGTSGGGGIVGMSNCYAAGEVGNAATESTGAMKGVAHPSSVGGFIGTARSSATSSLAVLANCFYDKQTTGMREYDVGNTSCLSLNKVISTGGSGNNSTYITGVLKTEIGQPGLQGCLSTTTDKQGAGLTQAPGAAPVSMNTGGTTVNVGFTGMRDDKACMGTYFNGSYSGWNDVSTKAQAGFGWDAADDQHYPELQAFSKNLAGFSAEDADVIAAFSRSSTATATLDPWARGLDPASGIATGTLLDADIYDTVRDVTIRFNLTNDVVDWTTTGTQDGLPGTHALSNVKGVEKNVLEILQDGNWYGDRFTPGMEWLMVTVDVNGTKATRRLRVTPTASLDAGESKNVYETTANPNALYDHADDVEFYFTTAARWAEHDYDVTTGVYPDTSPTGTTFPAGRSPNPITSMQTDFANGAADSLFDSHFGTVGTDANDHYGVVVDGLGVKSYPGVDMTYMARDYNEAIDADVSSKDNTANGSKVYTYIRPIEYFDAGDNNRVVTGNLLDMTIVTNADSFNGYQAFQSENTQFLVEYVWELGDGRLVRDAKIITIKSVPFDVNIDAYESGAIDSTIAEQKDALHDTDDALVGLKPAVTDAGAVDYTTTVAERTHAVVKAGVGSHVVAGWTVTNPLKQVNRIKVDFVFEPTTVGGQSQHYSAVLDNPKTGDTIIVPYKFWRIVTLSDGTYYSIPQIINRDYTVGEKVENGVTYQYLFFNKSGVDAETGIEVLDMEDDTQIDVELSESLILHKAIEGTYADKTKRFTFDLYYTDAASRTAEDKTGNDYTYLVWDDNGTPDDYSDDVQVTSGGNPVTGTITAKSDGNTSGSVSLTDDQYISIIGGTVGDTYRFVETATTDYTTQVAAEDGTLVGSAADPDTHDKWQHNADLLAQTTALDTGVLTLPELVKADAGDPSGYSAVPADYSRTKFTNTYKEVIPSGVAARSPWPWLLIAIALILAAAGIGYVVYRKRKGRVTVHTA